jgi:hypothetical protein
MGEISMPIPLADFQGEDECFLPLLTGLGLTLLLPQPLRRQTVALPQAAALRKERRGASFHPKTKGPEQFPIPVLILSAC